MIKTARVNQVNILIHLAVLCGLLTCATDSIFAADDISNTLHWSDIRDLYVEGRGWTNTASYYDRLPAKAEAMTVFRLWAFWLPALTLDWPIRPLM